MHSCDKHVGRKTRCVLTTGRSTTKAVSAQQVITQIFVVLAKDNPCYPEAAEGLL